MSGLGSSAMREESVQRAKAVFNTIKGWLASMNASSPQDGPGLSEKRTRSNSYSMVQAMMDFLDTQWNPPLTAAEKKWILSSWPGKVCNPGDTAARFYADLMGTDSLQESPPPASSARDRRLADSPSPYQASTTTRHSNYPANGVSHGASRDAAYTLALSREQSPAFPNNNASAIASAQDLSLQGISTPPLPNSKAAQYSQSSDTHSNMRFAASPGDDMWQAQRHWDNVELPSPPSTSPPGSSTRKQAVSFSTLASRQKSRGTAVMASDVSRGAIMQPSRRTSPSPQYATPSNTMTAVSSFSLGPHESATRTSAATIDAASIEASRLSRTSAPSIQRDDTTLLKNQIETLQAELAQLRRDKDNVVREKDELAKENRDLVARESEAAALEVLGEGTGTKTGTEWKVSVRLDEAMMLPTAVDVWDAGQTWQQTRTGAQLYATLSLTSRTEGEDCISVVSEKVKHSDKPQWRQLLHLLVDLTRHQDLVLQLILIDSQGAEHVWGRLLLPVSEVIARGNCEDWFNLVDQHDDPLRDHAGENSRVHLKFDVIEKEVDKLRVMLTQATVELNYVKSNYGTDLREQLRQLRSENKLLHATVGDLEDELLLAKEALVLAGKRGEERLVAQVQLLHKELRSAWQAQEALQRAPLVSAHEFDERLRTEMSKIARADSELEEVRSRRMDASMSARLGMSATDTSTLRPAAPSKDTSSVLDGLDSKFHRQPAAMLALINSSQAKRKEANVRASAAPPAASMTQTMASVTTTRDSSGAPSHVLLSSKAVQSAPGVSRVLKLAVVEARNLTLDSNTRCNAHCAVVMGKVKKSTHVETNTSRPHWGDERFSFDLPVGAEEASNRHVTVTVFNRGAYAKDECIGMAGLSLKRVRDSPGGSLDEWFPLTLTQGDKLEAAAPSVRLQAKIVDAPVSTSPRKMGTVRNMTVADSRTVVEF